MAASFEPTRALLRECLEYPGQSFTTLAKTAGCKHRSMVRSWIDGKTVPKSRQDWPRIEQRVRRHLESLRSVGADSEHCDADWRERLQAYLREHELTPEAFAERVGTSAWHGRRWAKFGEVPHDAAMPKISRTVGYDFDASVYRRAVAAARQEYGKPFPAGFEALERGAKDPATTAVAMHSAIHTLVVDLRKRGGVTTAKLAEAAKAAVGCVRCFAARSATQMAYGASAVATLLAGLARYADTLDARRVSSGDDGVARALELLQHRPEPPPNAPLQRLRVRWDRIEKLLRNRTHRCLRYRCPNGDPAVVMFVCFCAAYEQSTFTTSEAVRASGVPSSRLGRWVGGLALPDTVMLGELQEATSRLLGRVPAAHPVRPAPSDAAAVPAATPVASTPSEPAAPVPTDGASDILVGAASTLRGIRAMHRAGWRPDGTAREHLIAITKTAMEVGGLTPADLQPKLMTAAPDDRSPAVEAFREIAPNLRSRSGRGGGTRRS